MLFSDRIKSRHRRWWIDQEPHPHKQLGGKLQGRTFAQQKGCRVPELYALVDTVGEIPPFPTFPEKFVLKPTRGWSAKNVFVMNGEMNDLDKSLWSESQVLSQLANDPISNRADVKFMVEEYLVNWDQKPGIPLDYKFYMFGGQVAFIHVVERNGLKPAENRHWFMYEDWELITEPIVTSQQPQATSIAVPDCYEELMHDAKRLGNDLEMFMRVDMYATNKGAVFGEFTPQPHGGNGFTEWADEWLGSLWNGKEGVLD